MERDFLLIFSMVIVLILILPLVFTRAVSRDQ